MLKLKTGTSPSGKVEKQYNVEVSIKLVDKTEKNVETKGVNSSCPHSGTYQPENPFSS